MNYQNAFLQVLQSTGNFHSDLCALNWSEKKTKRGSSFCILVAKQVSGEGLPTPTAQDFKRRGPNSKQQGLSNTENWAHLLPTPQANCSKGMDPENIEQKGGKFYNKKTGAQIQSSPEQWAKLGLLPTPQAIDGSGPGRPLRLKKDCNRDPETPGSWRGDLKDFAFSGLLPTPVSNDSRGKENSPSEALRGSLSGFVARRLLPTPLASDNPDKNAGTQKQESVAHIAKRMAGTTAALNPAFVAEMMGFPPDWTVYPFAKNPEFCDYL